MAHLSSSYRLRESEYRSLGTKTCQLYTWALSLYQEEGSGSTNGSLWVAESKCKLGSTYANLKVCVQIWLWKYKLDGGYANQVPA